MKFLIPFYLGGTLQAFWPAPAAMVLAFLIGATAVWVFRSWCNTQIAQSAAQEDATNG